MAAKLSPEKKKEFENELTCAFCHSRFESPKLLPCLHLYCEKCLATMVEKAKDKTKLSCPQCQEVHQVPVRGVSDFKTYFTINNLLELMQINDAAENPDAKSKIKCTNCVDETKAVARCLTCPDYLCMECRATHKKFKRTFSHNVLTLEEIMKSETSAALKSLAKTKFCQDHQNEVLNLYCKTCKKVVCSHCKFDEHKTHELTDGFPPAIQGELEQLIKEVRDKEASFQAEIQSLDKVKVQNSESQTEHKKKIEDHFKQLTDAIEKRRRALLVELEEVYKIEDHFLENEKRDISSALARMTHSIRFTEQLLKLSDDLEVATMSTQTTEALEKLQKIPLEETRKPIRLSCEIKIGPLIPSVDRLGDLKQLMPSNRPRPLPQPLNGARPATPPGTPPPGTPSPKHPRRHAPPAPPKTSKPTPPLKRR